MKKSNFGARILFSGVALMVPAMAGAQQSAPADTAAEASDQGFQDIIVTARRREENAQTVPVSVTAFSGAALEQRGVRELQDLNAVAPGLRFTAEGGKNSTTVILRGLGKVSLGEGIPAVVPYFADVALIGDGANIPTYDIGNIQVLKGPQGTLFGRNTLGGAIVIKPEAPSYDFNGYIKGEYGRYQHRAIEGAINIPIVQDKVALRVAGQIRRRDGSIKDLSGGPDFNDIHQDSFRVSLLLEPFEGLTNTTIYDYFKADERAGGLYLYQHNPGVIPGLSAALDPQLAVYLQRQRAGGFHSAFSQFGQNVPQPAANRKLTGITNDTRLELGGITIRNIFGYRKNYANSVVNTAGVGGLTVGPNPFTLFVINTRSSREYLSNEFQVLGDLFDGRMNFIVGSFYNHDKPYAPGGSTFIAFSATGIAPAVSSHAENRNKAIFGQIGYKLTDALTLNLGGRYSWDKVAGCGGVVPGGGYASFGACKARAGLNLIDGVGVIKNSGSAPSWTIGLDYKASDDLFFYVTSRRGYRGANINTPLFETQFTTGGVGCALGTLAVRCPDLRPFQKIGEEKLTDVEVGTKWDWSTGDVRGRVNIAGFYSKYKGALQFFNVVGTGIPNTAPDNPTRQSIGINAADLTIKGVEFEMTIIPTAGLSFSANAAYTDTQVDKVSIPPIGGLRLTKADITKFSPKFSSTVGVNWMVPVEPFDSKFVISGDWFHTSKFGVQAGRSLPGYDLVNGRIALNEIGGGPVDVALLVRNLFNKNYFAAASNLLRTFPTNTAYVGDQRMWVLEAKYRF